MVGTMATSYPVHEKTNAPYPESENNMLAKTTTQIELRLNKL